MICASCGAELNKRASECALCQGDALLGGRYRLEGEVRRGGAGLLYAATDERGGDVVGVKEILLGDLDTPADASAVYAAARALFLANHAALPRWRHALRGGTPTDPRVYLIYDLIEGVTLADESNRTRYDERAVLILLADLLPVLAYLHAQQPPIIHGDLRPQNILRRADGHGISLSDFDLVRHRQRAARATRLTGFMAPEQRRDAPSASSDLYALGAIAIALHTRQDPTITLALRDGLSAWERYAELSAGTAQLLRDLVNPDPARRPRSAAALRPRVRDLIDGRGHIPAIKAAHAAPQKNNPTLLPDYLTEHDLPPLTLSSLPRPAVGAFAPHVAPLDGERRWRWRWWIVACATAVLGLVGLALMVS